jgi:hypothetical protein
MPPLTTAPSNAFTPEDLIQLPRPGSGEANPKGDLALIRVSQHTLKDDK